MIDKEGIRVYIDAQKLSELKAELREERKAKKQDLTKWRRKCLKHPRHAFEWSHNAFEVAAHLDVIGRALQASSLDRLKAVAQSEVRHRARYPSYSTSPTTNLMAACMAQAWAQLLDKLEGRL